MKKQIILASISPRRKQMMAHLGVPFLVIPSNYREVHQPNLKPAQLVKFLAEGKASAVVKKYPAAIVIGADTVVVHGGKIFGKPKSKAEAKKMLKNWSGGVHDVYTGVCVMDAQSGKKIIRSVRARIHFRNLNDGGIKNYIAHGEPMDKAGGYAVQGFGAGIIKKIEGDFTNTVGLPLDVVVSALRELGVKI